MRLLDRLRGRSLPDSVEIATDVGALLYPANCQMITPEVAREGRWDPWDAEALKKELRPGMHVLNLGAHIGYFALLAAREVGPDGKVTAIEAEPSNFALLQENMRRSTLDNVQVVHGAVSDHLGTLAMSLSPTNTGDHRAYRYDGATGTVSVPAVTVDAVLGQAEQVDFVFADIQGTEHVAMRGMSDMVERCHPPMLLEFWPQGIREFGDDPAGVLRTYRDLGYVLDVVGRNVGTDATEQELIAAAEPDGPGGFGTLLLRPV
ncbi:MAG TPA: FkbM family methyltransferase [Solirubrobacterales bacterium]